MMNKFFYIISLFIFSISIFSIEYKVGTGSEFKFFDKEGQKVNLSIYFTESSFTHLSIEYFFSTDDLFGIKSWQQFKMGINEKGLSLDEGYVQSQDMKVPEIMNKDFRENNDNGVVIEDFLFNKQSDIDKYKIGTETIEVPAGSLFTTHYRKSRGGQTVDLWISDKAGAIGLVKLISKGNDNQTYTIELMSLLKNVKPKIQPKLAVPLTEKGRMYIGKKNIPTQK